MRRIIGILFIVTLCLSVGGIVSAAGKGGTKAKDLSAMSQDDKIKLALSAAPEHIAKGAGVLLPGPDGKLQEVKKSENGFNCIPTIDPDVPTPDPMCFDAAVGQWLESVMANAEKPANTVPGVAYMARGGWHWEKDGKILMKKEAGAKAVKEPPHWMIIWPFSTADSKLPAMPNASGAYIMFDGTPYAHLMIYQDPKKMKER
ncbi:MAG TPA: hypothetical protein VFA38_06830 [Nitrospirales bacterium]|nr:hypothetical protein [Nitrospirales bacterium]